MENSVDDTTVDPRRIFPRQYEPLANTVGYVPQGIPVTKSFKTGRHALPILLRHAQRVRDFEATQPQPPKPHGEYEHFVERARLWNGANATLLDNFILDEPIQALSLHDTHGISSKDISHTTVTGPVISDQGHPTHNPMHTYETPQNMGAQHLTAKNPAFGQGPAPRFVPPTRGGLIPPLNANLRFAIESANESQFPIPADELPWDLKLLQQIPGEDDPFIETSRDTSISHVPSHANFGQSMSTTSLQQHQNVYTGGAAVDPPLLGLRIPAMGMNLDQQTITGQELETGDMSVLNWEPHPSSSPLSSVPGYISDLRMSPDTTPDKMVTERHDSVFNETETQYPSPSATGDPSNEAANTSYLEPLTRSCVYCYNQRKGCDRRRPCSRCRYAGFTAQQCVAHTIPRKRKLPDTDTLRRSTTAGRGGVKKFITPKKSPNQELKTPSKPTAARRSLRVKKLRVLSPRKGDEEQ